MTENKRDELLIDMHGRIERIDGVLTGGNGGGVCKDVAELKEDIKERVTYRVMGIVVGGVILVNSAIFGLLALLGVL